MDAGLAPQPIVDAGFAPQSIVNRDSLIVKSTVILGCRYSVIKASSFGRVAIIVSLVALWTVFCCRPLDPFFPAELEKQTSPMSFITPCPIFSFLRLLLSVLELVDQHLGCDRSTWLQISFFKQ
jgi:hypothetical protein